MQLSEPEVEALRALWRDEFGEEISIEEARHEAMLLLELFSALGEYLPSERGGAPSLTPPRQ